MPLKRPFEEMNAKNVLQREDITFIWKCSHPVPTTFFSNFSDKEEFLMKLKKNKNKIFHNVSLGQINKKNTAWH